MGMCMILFVTEWLPMSVTGVLGCALLVLGGVADFSVVFSGFSNEIVFLMVSAMVVGNAMFKTGIAQLMAVQSYAWPEEMRYCSLR